MGFADPEQSENGKGRKAKYKKKAIEVEEAALPLQEHCLPLSNLDLLLPPVDVSVFFCYEKPRKRNDLAFAPMVRILKNALAQTLVSFYAFAGEVIMSSAGEPC
ncbi:hypothetical protein MRB53_022277 [Persea americana]|uniref:Uncharacterized protein n=1 Tax=Persea americana TaxID=3435 RepID=A0ACC2L6A2_PERAE|nr:hypothetical protein MRB53_022277 [Persea americana]